MSVQNILTIGLLLLMLQGCGESSNSPNSPSANTFIMVLGIAQDAGFPQADCHKECCSMAWNRHDTRKMVSSLALVDLDAGYHWIIDATPDFKDQLYLVSNQWGTELGGIFLTHAHMGHYTGLMHLGKEGMGSDQVPVYAMPRMDSYLKNNGPWSQLVDLSNIEIRSLRSDSTITLTDSLKITPVLVPHRDEYSETVGYYVSGPSSKALFIPDIDKWEKWDRDLKSEITKVNWAFIDGSFYKAGELPGRDMSTIPHPFVQETVQLLKGLDNAHKAKVHFIHFNHTNPLLQAASDAHEDLAGLGYKLAQERATYPL